MSYVYKTGTVQIQQITTVNSNTVNPDTYTPQCPLCLTPTHDTNHLFNCSRMPTQHDATSSWKTTLKAAGLIQESDSKLASLIQERLRDGFLIQKRLRGGYSKISLKDE